MRLLGILFFSVFASVSLAGCQTTSPVSQPAAAVRSIDGSVRVVDHSAELDPEALRRLADQTEREYLQLQQLFGVHVGHVTVNVRKTGVGRHFPPAAIRIPMTTIAKRTAITAHELTHLLNQGWASMVLKEGLAVYGQNRIGEQPGWPNYKRGIHRAAHAAIIAPAAPVRSPAGAEQAFATARLGQTVKRRAAYNVSGSWVTWLINQRMGGNLDRFMATLYRSGDYPAATGKSYAWLDAAWRRFVARRASARQQPAN